MFIGHFAVGFAAKKVQPSISLGILFAATQWLDLLWPVLLLLGVERVDIAPGRNPTVPLAFTYYPFTHGLLMVLGWSLLAAFVYWLISRRRRAALVVGACVLSHWVLDVLVHEPDLPLLMGDSDKLGLGLWNYRMIALTVETLIYIAGVALYLRATRAQSRANQYGLWSLIIFLYAIQLANYFGPPPSEVKSVAVAGLLQWVLVLWAYLVDRHRLSRGKKI